MTHPLPLTALVTAGIAGALVGYSLYTLFLRPKPTWSVDQIKRDTAKLLDQVRQTSNSLVWDSEPRIPDGLARSSAMVTITAHYEERDPSTGKWTIPAVAVQELSAGEELPYPGRLAIHYVVLTTGGARRDGTTLTFGVV